MYALRSNGKPIVEDLDQLRDKEKPIPNNAKRLLGNTNRLPGKTEQSQNGGKQSRARVRRNWS
jgi:hypothetical protein